jgi:hypothetical protein
MFPNILFNITLLHEFFDSAIPAAWIMLDKAGNYLTVMNANSVSDLNLIKTCLPFKNLLEVDEERNK